ncbi:protein DETOXIFICATION 16 isoform X2 [Arachis ipaensis]|uniref:protein DETOXIFICATION 16 isoform X2 n=1 Tax=Arachis ipaensis TaxID=130454 RepID=UPI000A2B414A|nr:protein DETOXIFICATION 16 isoform X2 [Arachis ipaensis]XP_025655801.1 protein DETOXIFICATION 16 isoform X2 [Arachis hypogaea]
MEREEHQKASLHSPLVQDWGEQDKTKSIEKSEVLEEVKKQLWLSGPLVSVSLLNYCLQVISVMFVGHLGELPLSGASMATSFASVTGFSLLVGMASALDTLCGQSYGAKQHRMLGIHMQRAMLILMIVSVPLAVIWINTRSILMFLGQDPEISTEAGSYAQLMVPSLFAYGLLQCLNRFLQTQNIVFPMVFCSGITTLLHVLICWIMVFKSGLGSRGAAIANSISYWINVLLLSLYVKLSPSCARTWSGFSKEAFQNIPSFLRLAIPSAVMVCLEMWSFEMMVLLSGLLPNPQLETSVLSICLNTAAAVWMIPFGLSGAVSNEGEVVDYVAVMLPILATSNFLDGLQCVLSGTARGCGWQKIGAYVNLGSYYLVGIPSAILLAFTFHIGGKGLWLGIICALIVQVLSLLTITIRTDWDQEAKKATDRVFDSITPDSIVS